MSTTLLASLRLVPEEVDGLVLIFLDELEAVALVPARRERVHRDLPAWLKNCQSKELFFFVTMYPFQHTVCPRSSDPFYTISYCVKWITTSWTHSIDMEKASKYLLPWAKTPNVQLL